MASGERKTTLVFAIDLGTTYSGVAYAYCPNNAIPNATGIHVVLRWPAAQAGSVDKSKIPSLIHYASEDAQPQFGYDIPENVKAIAWFKLLLLEENDLPKHLQSAAEFSFATGTISKLGKNIVDVVADYLRMLWDASLDDARRTHAGLVEMCRFHVVFTVPAIWKDYARDKMTAAAKRAGLLDPRAAGETTWTFVSEPEAAALATLQCDILQRPDFDVGDTFIVLDCGGGTADVISYIFEERHPAAIRECVPGDGALAGAGLIDRAFRNLLRQSAGPGEWQSYDAGLLQDALQNFWHDRIKATFTNNGDTLWPFRVGAKQYRFNSPQIKATFDSVVPKIKNLVRTQMRAIADQGKAKPKFIILVGGFGRSPYLRESIETLATANDPPTQVLQAPGNLPWTAICRGAVLHGASELERPAHAEQGIQVRGRKARFSWGYTFTADWMREMRDLFDYGETQWDAVRGTRVVPDAIDWMISKGEDVSSTSKDFPCRLYFPANETGVQEHTSKIVHFRGPLNARPDRFQEGVAGLEVGRIVTIATPGDIQALPRVINEQGEQVPVFDYVWRLQISGEAMSGTVRQNDEQIGEATQVMSVEEC